jgi:hypothetical protein
MRCETAKRNLFKIPMAVARSIGDLAVGIDLYDFKELQLFQKSMLRFCQRTRQILAG